MIAGPSSQTSLSEDVATGGFDWEIKISIVVGMSKCCLADGAGRVVLGKGEHAYLGEFELCLLRFFVLCNNRFLPNSNALVFNDRSELKDECSLLVGWWLHFGIPMGMGVFDAVPEFVVKQPKD